MKILTNKQYQDLLNTIEHKDKSIVDLRDKYIEATNLKELLKEIVNKTGLPTPKFGANNLTCDYADGVSWTNIHTNFNLPDNVLQYVDDILGGKVIKQEGNKCLVIDKNGNVKTGLTKEKVDKNYTYKLVRE
jgi:hypothetical protein